ncbi:hypothetical protein PENANT_c048G10899 [Penicillium antarcticum]|uniref:Ketoreductase (KR) domain-containing protein n=1 Tax=Penicillium antarcticum TaxID=416450 RepID=A0A1V6PRE1_9EURO|nr:hypothetical protein PENANT_c048G10899 [Penicillium antarcticum]
MTGIFTYRNFSLDDVPDLKERVAVVTGGHAGIGKGTYKITAQLLLHGIESVIILARSEDKYIAACKEWRQTEAISLNEDDSRVKFVKCDLGDIEDVKAATEKIKELTDRVHILVCNAALGVPNEYTRSPQNIERVFATNCVGHQVLTTLLMPLLKHGVVTVRNGDELDLDLLTSSTRTKWPALYDGVWRYGRSKLGNILFAKELSRRLLNDRDPASKHIYVNSFFPGNIVTDQWLDWSSYFGSFFGWLMRLCGSSWGQTLEDGAATALYLAAAAEVREGNIRGQYFIPIATLCEPSSIAGRLKVSRDLWDWIDAQATETLGLDWEWQS